jgi:predicted dehydrogenase
MPGGRRLHVVFLGAGHIAGVHARHLKPSDDVRVSFASRDRARAEALRARRGGEQAYGSYDEALADPDVDMVVVSVPPVHHRALTSRAIAAGKHVLVEKPAFLTLADYDEVARERDAAGVAVIVGENDHYKPQLVTLRSMLGSGVIGDLVMVSLVTVADKPKAPGDWRNDEAMAGGDAFFEEGIHWLHVAGELGPRLVAATGLRPAPAPDVAGDRRARSMVVGLTYDSGATGALLYSREVPSLLQGVRISKLYGREGVITFESNGAGAIARGRGRPRVHVPGPAELRDVRGYKAMYADFVAAVREGRQPSMSVERAREDHVLMEMVRGGGHGG